MNNQSSRVSVNADVLSETLEGEEVLLNLNTKTYFGLNETGTRIWQLLRTQTDTENIVEILTHEYAVSREDAQEHLSKLLHELKKNRLIEIA